METGFRAVLPSSRSNFLSAQAWLRFLCVMPNAAALALRLLLRTVRSQKDFYSCPVCRPRVLSVGGCVQGTEHVARDACPCDLRSGMH